MKLIQALLNNRAVQIIALLAGTWLLFNCIFFLGTNPSQWIDAVFQWLTRLAWKHIADSALRDFLVYGLITGLGGFLVYLPNIMLLFLFSHALHDSGISPRVARLVGPLFRCVGLNGGSFQPLLFGFGCSVTAIHGAGLLQNPKNRLLTMLISPFMSCGSKYGVYVLLISFVFGPKLAGTVLFGLYAAGVVTAVISASIFRLILGIRKDSTEEVTELARLQWPSVLKIIRQTIADGWLFCKKAGSIIVLASIIIWALSYWPGVSSGQYHEIRERARQTGQIIPSRLSLSYHNSYAAAIGQFIEPVFRPLGQNWKTSIALVTSLAGRTAIISTLVTLYGIENSPESGNTLVHALSADPDFSRPGGIAMMIFVLLCGSCLASIMMFFNETKSYLLTSLFIAYPIAVAWAAGAGAYSLLKILLK